VARFGRLPADANAAGNRSGSDIMSIIRAVIVAGFLISACAYAEQQNDLREFRVGMPISALPESGYAAFACASDPAKKLSGWGGHQTCPAHADGTRAISFRYGNGGSPEDDDGGKTQVGGQPVNLALLIAKDGPGDGLVAGIRIDTDPHARLYMHKKAYLFALQVRARFGEDGWTCQKAAPTPTEQPVGGVFVHEHCEKATASRHFILDRQLFRDPAKDLRDFTDATQLTILRPG
jgi:hypothetical protein